MLNTRDKIGMAGACRLGDAVTYIAPLGRYTSTSPILLSQKSFLHNTIAQGFTQL